MSVGDGLLLAVDQGTGSTKSILVDPAGTVVGRAAVALEQTHPRQGWVEQDADALWTSTLASIEACLDAAGRSRVDVTALALSVQRETVVAWDRRDGRALGPAISWQDQRTLERSQQLTDEGHAERVRRISGLPLDPMFSALKIAWVLDQVDPDRVRARRGEIVVGTVDAWLLHRMGAEPVAERGTASRTQLLDVSTGTWSADLLSVFDVPEAVLPRVVGSTGPFTTTTTIPGLEHAPVVAVLADSHAALFSHAGWRPGTVKATYGTGSSVMTLGEALDDPALCTTIAWDLGEPERAIEANIRSTGRTMTWLAATLGCSADDLFADAARADADDATVIVPAFGGLGAPWWDATATPVMAGFTLGTGRPEVADAGLRSIAHQVQDVLEAFARAGHVPTELAADGGMTRSARLMQHQADLSRTAVHASTNPGLSARGAADLAGISCGWWEMGDLERRKTETEVYTAALPSEAAAAERDRWAAALQRSIHHDRPEARP